LKCPSSFIKKFNNIFTLSPRPLHRILHLIINNMGMDLRGADIGMFQGFLHHAEIFGLAVEVGGEGVAEGVRADALL